MLKRKDLTKKTDELIIERYNEGNSTFSQIQNEFSISYRTLLRVLKEYSVPKKSERYTTEQYESAIKDFMNGTLQKDVCEKYGMSNVSLNNYMKNKGIIYKNQHGRRKHFNQFYFKSIDSEHKAYWFGFLYADGALTKSNSYDENPNRLKINISSKDRELIVLFLKDIESENIEIQDYTPKGTYSENQMSRVVLNSINLCNDMVNNGFRLLKRYSNSDIFNFIPEELQRHFIRGFFDGDGSVSQSGYSVSFHGQKGIIEPINEILIKEGLDKKELMTYSDRRKDKSHQLFFKNKESVQKMYNYMYKDATVYLNRKYAIFLEKI